MDHLSSLSRAARMSGVRHNTPQALIQAGRLHPFEGSIRVSELAQQFPEVDPECARLPDGMQRLQAVALVTRPFQRTSKRR